MSWKIGENYHFQVLNLFLVTQYTSNWHTGLFHAGMALSCHFWRGSGFWPKLWGINVFSHDFEEVKNFLGATKIHPWFHVSKFGTKKLLWSELWFSTFIKCDYIHVDAKYSCPYKNWLRKLKFGQNYHEYYQKRYYTEKWKLIFLTIFMGFCGKLGVNSWKIGRFQWKASENGQKCTNFNFSFNKYIRVIAAKF